MYIYQQRTVLHYVHEKIGSSSVSSRDLYLHVLINHVTFLLIIILILF